MNTKFEKEIFKLVADGHTPQDAIKNVRMNYPKLLVKWKKEILRAPCIDQKRREDIQRIFDLGSKKDPTTDEFLELRLLKEKLKKFRPFQRYAWLEAVPVIDILNEF